MTFHIQEGTVYGEPYYAVKTYQPIPWAKMEEWCVNAFGPSGTEDKPGAWSPYERWYANNSIFWFKDKKDLEWFLLRWQ